jgi:hypothetical protein
VKNIPAASAPNLPAAARRNVAWVRGRGRKVRIDAGRPERRGPAATGPRSTTAPAAASAAPNSGE